MADKVSMRIAYGQALAAYGAQNKNVVVLDADVSASTQTHYFAKVFPDRFYNVGIAEAGMVDVAAGFALRGKIPFVNTFAFLQGTGGTPPVPEPQTYALMLGGLGHVGLIARRRKG